MQHALHALKSRIISPKTEIDIGFLGRLLEPRLVRRAGKLVAAEEPYDACTFAAYQADRIPRAERKKFRVFDLLTARVKRGARLFKAVSRAYELAGKPDLAAQACTDAVTHSLGFKHIKSYQFYWRAAQLFEMAYSSSNNADFLKEAALGYFTAALTMRSRINHHLHLASARLFAKSAKLYAQAGDDKNMRQSAFLAQYEYEDAAQRCDGHMSTERIDPHYRSILQEGYDALCSIDKERADSILYMLALSKQRELTRLESEKNPQREKVLGLFEECVSLYKTLGRQDHIATLSFFTGHSMISYCPEDGKRLMLESSALFEQMGAPQDACMVLFYLACDQSITKPEQMDYFLRAGRLFKKACDAGTTTSTLAYKPEYNKRLFAMSFAIAATDFYKSDPEKAALLHMATAQLFYMQGFYGRAKEHFLFAAKIATDPSTEAEALKQADACKPKI